MEQDALQRIGDDAAAAGIWSRIQDRLERLGPFDVEVKKGSLHITRGRAFLGVHPRKGALLLNIVTADPIEAPRIRRSERISARRVHNEVLVAAEDEVDDELTEWIRSAYRLADPGAVQG